MKKTLLILALFSSASIGLAGGHGEKPHTSPWSNFTLENTVQAMPEGNAIRGQQIHSQMMCNACHGEFGESPSRNYASINAQPSEYTIKLMIDYRDGRRWEAYKQSNIMVKLAQALNDQQISDLAAFYAQAKPLAYSANTQLTPEEFAKIDHIVRKGDNNRMLTPCASCHGAQGEGRNIVPALAGQVPEYFVRTMQAYKTGDRHNDVEQGMSQFTHNLTDQEIQQFAHYYANIGEKQ